MLRILQHGNSIPYAWAVDPSCAFQPGMIAQLTTLGNTIVATVSNGTAPIGIIDDIKTTAFYAPSISEVVIAGPIVGVYNSNNDLVTPVDVKMELQNSNVQASSFISYDIDLELIARNGVVVFLAGTSLNFDLDGDGIPDSIRTVVSYNYQIPNVPGDDSTQGSGRMTVWFNRMIAATDQFDTSVRYPLGCALFCGQDGKLTSKQWSEDLPGIAICTGPPSSILSSLEFLYL